VSLLGEPRRYVRVFDVNNAGWRAIRDDAEHFREVLYDWFDPEALARQWPGPEVTITTADVIAGSAAMKNLMGLALCIGGWSDPPVLGGLHLAVDTDRTVSQPFASQSQRVAGT
jgi:hypothetical protein